MFNRITLSIIALAAIFTFTGCQTSKTAGSQRWNSYGEEVDVTEIVSIGSLKGDEKDIWVSGEIFEVCTHQGCWIRIKDPADPKAGDLFVKTKGHAYLVPINSKGRAARVYGVCELSEMSVQDQQHYAEEAGKSEAEIALITQPKKMITFHAATIEIEGSGLDKPLDQGGG